MTPDDYDVLFEQAREGAPFSNSSQGMRWMGSWCDRCVHDRPARQGREGEGCPLILVALMHRTPAQWITLTEEDAVHGSYQCTEFRDDDGGPGPEPQPVADPPGQSALFGRTGFEGVRMLSSRPVSAGAGVTG